MLPNRSRIPDPEALFHPDEVSLFSDSSSSSDSSMTDPDLSYDRGDPSNEFDAWAARQTLLSLVSGALVVGRMAYHLVAFTGGLYLAAGTFTSLAPLMDRSLSWAPLVLVISIAAFLASPFWGLMLSYALRRLAPSIFIFAIRFKEFDAHTHRCLLSIGLGLGLAALRFLVALITLVDTTSPCGEWTPTCAAAAALALAKQVASVWTNIVADLATAIAVAFVPLAAVWFLAWRLKPDEPAPNAHYLFLALKVAVVALTLAQIWVTVSLGRQNEILQRELDTCRNGTTGHRVGAIGAITGLGGAAEQVAIAADIVAANEQVLELETYLIPKMIL